MVSPLANVYPPMPSTYYCPTPVAPGPYELQYPGQYAGMPYMARTYGMGRGTDVLACFVSPRTTRLKIIRR